MHIFKHAKHYIFTAFLCLAVFSAHPAFANLGITPTIISFEDGERYKDVTLINTSEDTKTYVMSWKFFEMQETGASYKTIDASLTEFDVSKYVFFTPRRVTIPAKGSQKVRMAFRRPKEVPNGDYYAHLLFSPADSPDLSEEKQEEKSSSAGVSVRVGYSIPVVVRAGSFDEQAKIGQIHVKRSSQNRLVVDVPVMRITDDYGALAKLEAYHVPSNGDKDKLVGEVVNANVFTEVKQRIIPVTLREEIKGGSLKILLKSSKKDSDVVFDQQVFPLN